MRIETLFKNIRAATRDLSVLPLSSSPPAAAAAQQRAAAQAEAAALLRQLLQVNPPLPPPDPEARKRTVNPTCCRASPELRTPDWGYAACASCRRRWLLVARRRRVRSGASFCFCSWSCSRLTMRLSSCRLMISCSSCRSLIHAHAHTISRFPPPLLGCSLSLSFSLSARSVSLSRSRSLFVQATACSLSSLTPSPSCPLHFVIL
jgi:hypothetical protein